MEEIKVNEYIRTEDGIIAKCTKIEHNRYEFDKLCECYTDIDGEEIFLHDYMNDYPYGVIKAKSTNIIDLIEVGDYVNGYKVRATYLEGERQYIKFEKINDIRMYEKDIKSIVTKEQFESMKYEVNHASNIT